MIAGATPMSHAQKVITTTFMDWADEDSLVGSVFEVEAGKVVSRR